MCVILIAHRAHSRWNLILAANRDEFHARPTAPVAPWPEHPGLLAGRDLEAGGTWLGVNAAGRVCAVTNLRGAGPAPGPHSRGHLVRDFLAPQAPTLSDYVAALEPRTGDYAGCNLLMADSTTLHWWSPRGQLRLAPGVFGISNAGMDEPAWTKVERLRVAYASLESLDHQPLEDALLSLLSDAESASTEGGRPLEDAIFVRAGAYGTRCSTLVMRDDEGNVILRERRYDATARISGEDRYALDKRHGTWHRG
jgi:uncharacterized protein with NRDE domain